MFAELEDYPFARDTFNNLWLEADATSGAAVLLEDAPEYDSFVNPSFLVSTLGDVASATSWLLQNPEVIFSLPTNIVLNCLAYGSQRRTVL
jgi:hypothetical protein